MTFKEYQYKGLHCTEIEGKPYYLKKNMLGGYRVISPIVREDGSMNWFSLLTGGGWSNLAKVLVIVLFLIILTYSYSHDTAACFKIMNNHTYFQSLCSNYNLGQYIGQTDTSLNLTNIRMPIPFGERVFNLT